MLLRDLAESMLGIRENLVSVAGLRARFWNARVVAEATCLPRPRTVPVHRPGFCFAGKEAVGDGDPESGFTTPQFLLVFVAVLPGLFQDRVLALFGIQPGPALDQTLGYLPQIVCPALLVVVAWILATFVRFVFKRAMSTTETGKEDTEAVESGAILPLPDSLPNVLFWTVFVLFLPLVLVSLGDKQLEEVENSLFQLSPIVSTGIVILVFLWLVLRVVQRILTSGGRASNLKTIVESEPEKEH